MSEKIIHYPNLVSFLRRHGKSAEDIGTVIQKSRQNAHWKLVKKTTSRGKVLYFDIDEANRIIDFVVSTEEKYLTDKYGENWKAEWNSRWGHITDWFKYLFFDEVVTNVTKAS